MQTINEIQTTTKYSCKIMSNVVSLFIKENIKKPTLFIDVNFKETIEWTQERCLYP